MYGDDLTNFELIVTMRYLPTAISVLVHVEVVAIPIVIGRFVRDDGSGCSLFPLSHDPSRIPPINAKQRSDHKWRCE